MAMTMMSLMGVFYDVMYAGWHLATQVMYSIGVVLLLLCEIYVRAQLCCGVKHGAAYRTLSLVLFVSCKYILHGCFELPAVYNS